MKIRDKKETVVPLIEHGVTIFKSKIHTQRERERGTKNKLYSRRQ